MKKRYAWSASKNNRLKQERGVSFEEILEAIASGGLVDVVEHTNPRRYRNQRVFVVRWNRYLFLVPFVESESCIFLKTIIPSRKMQKKYGGTQ